MAESDFVSPWADPAPATTPAPPPAATPVRRPRSTLAWNLVSTVILFGWLAFQMGWIWGLAGVVGVFVHEFGHVLAINALGFGPSRIRIIPFFGGAATLPRAPDTDFKGVLIALAGPAFGLLAAIPFFVAGAHDPQFLDGAFFIASINLLNLLPAPPLDGSKALGPVLARIHPVLERVALVLSGGAAAWWTFTHGWVVLPIFIAISVVGLLRTRFLRPPARPLGWGEWAAALGLYLGVATLCAAVVAFALAGMNLAGPLHALGVSGGRP